MPTECPDGLGDAGTTLWEEVTASYELLPDELRLLAAGCATLDELRTLEAALAGVEPVTAGSTGQERVHPLFAEVRAHRLALRTLLGSLGITEAEDSRHDGAAKSAAGRHLARQRWGQLGAA